MSERDGGQKAEEGGEGGESEHSHDVMTGGSEKGAVEGVHANGNSSKHEAGEMA